VVSSWVIPYAAVRFVGLPLRGLPAVVDKKSSGVDTRTAAAPVAARHIVTVPFQDQITLTREAGGHLGLQSRVGLR
jgi:hypothetical protein